MKHYTCMFMLLLTASLSAHATVPFRDMDRWSSTKRYGLGDVVTVDYDIYVSLLPSRNKMPQSNPPFWKRVNLSTQLEFRPYKLYLPGQVVSHNSRYYLTRRLSILPHARLLDDIENRWMAFTHPGLHHNIPPNLGTPPELDTLLGTDSNTNGVRDDFEREMIYSGLPSSIIQSALDAGRIYGQVLELGTSGSLDGGAETVNLAIHWIYSEACRRDHERNNQGEVWPMSSYFNSLPRIEALFQISSVFADLVDLNVTSVPDVDPCVAIALYR